MRPFRMMKSNCRATLGQDSRGGCPTWLVVGLTTGDRRLFWLQRLRDHYLAFEILHHIGVEPDFGGALGQRHLINLVLELEQSVEQIFRTRRATNHVDIRRDDLVHTLEDRIGIKRTPYRR